MDMNPADFAHRYWRFLAPTWFMPGVIMALVVANDFGGSPFRDVRWNVILVFPLMIGSTLAAGYLQRRERIPWGVFYLIWLGPMMAVWMCLVFVRGAILASLGRPL